MPNKYIHVADAVLSAFIGAAFAIGLCGGDGGPSRHTIEEIVNSRVQRAEDILTQKIEETKATLQQGAIYTIKERQFYCFPAEEKK